MAVTDYDPIAGNNTAVGGVSIAEGWAPADANNAIRALMADIATGIANGDFASTSGFQAQDPTLTALAGLAVADGDLIQATGPDAFTALATTAYGRTLLALADAAALRTSLGGVTSSGSNLSANGFLTLDIGGTGLTIQWGSGTLGANTNGTISFPTAFTSFGRCIASGGSSDTGREGGIDTVGSAGLTSQAIVNNSATSVTYQFIAIGV